MAAIRKSSATATRGSLGTRALAVMLALFLATVSAIAMLLVSQGSASAHADTFTYNDHYYRLTNPGSWQHSEDEAVAMGGHLVTVNDQAEQDWLFETFVYMHWIGLTDKTTEGTFEWISGEPVTYTNWYEGEPNDAGGIEDVAAQGYGGTYWNDWSGSEGFSGIAEFNQEPPPPPPSVAWTNPSDEARRVGRATTVTAYFSESMDETTLDDTSTVQLFAGNSKKTVKGEVSYDEAQAAVTLTPFSKLDAKTTYTVKIKGGESGVKDLEENTFGPDYIWTFTTDSHLEPGPTATATASAMPSAAGGGNSVSATSNAAEAHQMAFLPTTGPLAVLALIAAGGLVSISVLRRS